VKQDLVYALRNLWKSPGYAAVTVLTLALGIGATTAIFSVVNGVVLKSLPYDDPDRLITIWDVNHEKDLSHEPVSPVTFMDYRALSQVLVDAAGWWRPEVTLRDRAKEPVRANTVEVSGNFLSVVGVSPTLGGGFEAGVFHSSDRVVLISHRMWESRFAADPGIIGETVRLNEQAHAIVGVMPPGFHFPGDTDVWQRLTWDFQRHSRGARFVESLARMRPGVPVAAVQRELDALTGRLATEFAATNRGWNSRAIPLHEEVIGGYRSTLFVLLTAVGLLLTIACINVASLLMARAASRAREVAVRAAIGATRRRLIRQFRTESLTLAAAGGLLGIVLASAATRLVVATARFDIPRLSEVSVDARALIFALGLILATAILFGLLPALLMSRVDLQGVMKDGGRGHSGRGGRRIHRLLVSAEVALAVMLLAGAGLLVRSVGRLTAEPPGFEPAAVVTTGIQLSGPGYSGWPQVERFHSALIQSIQQYDGVEAAGGGNFLPLTPGWRVGFVIPSLPGPAGAPARGEEPTAQYHSVSEGYFETLQVPVLRGRDFSSHDTALSRGVVIINESLARRYFGDADPVGTRLRSLARGIGPLGFSLIDEREHEIIGVVADVKNSTLQGAAEPAVFHSTRQFPFRHVYLVARGSDPSRVGAAIRDAVRRADPGLPSPELRMMDNVVGASLERPRLLMSMFGAFAVSALALALLGIYGLLSYAVTERQQELSIRMALGARPAGVRWLVVREGMVLALAGCASGMIAAYAIARQADSALYGVSAGDPAALIAVGGIALISAMTACAIPAWRASRINPLAGLKE
jgi:putative ABC transport system permease protein